MADQLSRKRPATSVSRGKTPRSSLTTNTNPSISNLSSVPPKKRFRSYIEPQQITDQKSSKEQQQSAQPQQENSLVNNQSVEKQKKTYYLRSSSLKENSRLATQTNHVTSASVTIASAASTTSAASTVTTSSATVTTSSSGSLLPPPPPLSQPSRSESSHTGGVSEIVRHNLGRNFVRVRRNATVLANNNNQSVDQTATPSTSRSSFISSNSTTVSSPLRRSAAVLRRSTRNKYKNIESNTNSKSTTGNCKSKSTGPKERTSNASSATESTAQNAATITTASDGRRSVRGHNNNKIGVIATTSAMNNNQSETGTGSGNKDSSVPLSMPLINDTANSNSSIPTTGSASTSSSSNSGQSVATRGLMPTMINTGTESLPALIIDSESDENDVGRLQAILESKGLPSHILGALGPRMQHILNRTIGSNSISSKVSNLLTCLQSNNDENQLQAVTEICQMLVMGNEETLAGFPIKQAIPVLIKLLEADHNFEMMNHACRALTYMMESLPRSTHQISESVPVFLQKLQVIQCMDVAEQSLTALDMLSKRHSKAILFARGVSICLKYLDFFSINAQRSALAIASNCCQNIRGDEFSLVIDSLPSLSSRLTNHDKRSVESICLLFSRLVDSYHNDSQKLSEIISPELLANLQQLLVTTPALISTNIFITVLRMLSIICANSKYLTMTLLRQNISETLLFLLIGSPVLTSDHVELISHSPQELFEITSLIGELMPRLPTDGIFSVDGILEKPLQSSNNLTAVWQWRDERGNWNSYSAFDSKIIETAHMFGEEDISVSFSGRVYIVDFSKMTQTNEDTGTSKAIRRQLLSTSKNTQIDNSSSQSSSSLLSTSSANASVKIEDDSLQSTSLNDEKECANENNSKISESGTYVYVNEDRQLISGFIQSLFSVLYEVYSSSAGPAVRNKCLRALLRMVYFASSDLLKDVMRTEVVSNHIAGMLASSDLRIVVGSLQMAHVLMKKLPDVFGIHFKREGVFFQITELTESHIDNSNIVVRTTTEHTKDNSNIPLTDVTISDSGSSVPSQEGEVVNKGISLSSSGSSSFTQVRFTDALKRKRLGKRSTCAYFGRAKGRNENLEEVTISSNQATSSRAILEDMIYRTSLLASTSTSQSTSSTPPIPIPSKGSKNSSNANNSNNNSSILATFARWGRNNERYFTGGSSREQISSHSSSISSCFSNNRSSNYYNANQLNISNNSPTNENLNQTTISTHNREKTKNWIRDQSTRFLETYFNTSSDSISDTGNILKRLKAANLKLQKNEENSLEALKEICQIFLEADVTPFEVNHSGFVKVILDYLTKSEENLRYFLHVFTELPIDKNLFDFQLNSIKTAGFSALVYKLNACISQLEQFPVRVHEYPQSSCTSGNRNNINALRFFNTHQLKCNLQRHPQCTNLKQWKGGTVKIDPFAVIHAIERYLVLRGYANIRDRESADSDDDSEDDLDDNLASVTTSTSNTKHRLQFLMGDHVLPYNMTIYQAIRQFSPFVNANSGMMHNLQDHAEIDLETEVPLGHASLWVQTHILYYRTPVEDTNNNNTEASTSNLASTSRASSISSATIASVNATQMALSSTSISSGSGVNLRSSSIASNLMSNSSSSTTSRKSKNSSKKVDLVWNEGIIPTAVSPLTSYLKSPIIEISIHDPCLEVMSLVRLLYGLNRYWYSLYYSPYQSELLPSYEFINNKITAKLNRQLQDPLSLMTSTLPGWLGQLGNFCPFLFPFESRQLLFYILAFDRDRALQRLLDSIPELSPTDSYDRVTPRLDRRKRTINRKDILKQAESLMQDLSNTRAMLEIQYDEEVGTGLGPTLEFYALVSQELQKPELEIWNRDSMLHGALYPVPLSKYSKASLLTKIRSKYRFLGKFMAKALMDSRLIDLPLSTAFYKWMLGQESTVNLADLAYVVPEVQKTLIHFQKLITMKEKIENNSSLSNNEKSKQIEALKYNDECSIEDLTLDFVLPGYQHIDLFRNGRNQSVTIHNLRKYNDLVIHWMLKDGVQRQMDAFREGFSSVFPISHLSLFYPEEMEALFCGNSSVWDIKMLSECCRPDHGYTFESKAIKFLFEILSSYNYQEQRAFLQFLTGSPRLPVGGFKALTPQLTVVRKTFDKIINPDDYLPSVMTCVNYLKLPDYTTIEIMQQKLRIAINEGQKSFYLS